ncbi:hypothetical protein [Duganella sp. OV510]|uniref:hypothetical protein n=1 Tax=Duganella sp. OV510 TaxID=1881039 RepID=UPI0035A69CAA
MRNGDTGTVMLALLIGVDGKVADSRVENPAASASWTVPPRPASACADSNPVRWKAHRNSPGQKCNTPGAWTDTR